MVDNIRVPKSRFRRELRKWMRYIKTNPECVIYMTVRNKDCGVFISPESYDNLVDDINNMKELNDG